MQVLLHQKDERYRRLGKARKTASFFDQISRDPFFIGDRLMSKKNVKIKIPRLLNVMKTPKSGTIIFGEQ